MVPFLAIFRLVQMWAFCFQFEALPNLPSLALEISFQGNDRLLGTEI